MPVIQDRSIAEPAVEPLYPSPTAPQGLAAPPTEGVAAPQQPVQVVVVPAPKPVAGTDGAAAAAALEVRLVSHSTLFYWWPIWVVGYIMAGLTAVQGHTFMVEGHAVKVHASNNVGLLFMFTLFGVILISNVSVRGLASALVIMGMVLLTVLFAYMGIWDNIINFFDGLNIYLNQGAYAWMATLMLIIWAFTTFVVDRMSYWSVTPGQMTNKHLFGASEKSYDTENMSFEKRRDDLFRHWILGIGSGDLTINAFNAGQRQEIHVPNVLFVGTKIEAVQKLIAMEQTQVI